MTSLPDYAELLCVSSFSFQYGASQPAELVRRAHALGYQALAITDECSMAGIVRAHEAAREVGLALIVGTQLRLTDGQRLALLAPSETAYRQLCTLITRARRAADKGRYQLDRAGLHSVDECIGLWIPGVQPDLQAMAWFADLSLRMKCVACTHDLSQQADVRLQTLCQAAERLQLLAVASGDVHYHVRERRPLHDVLTAIRLGVSVDHIGRQAFANGEHHLRPRATLQKLFPPELLAATAAVAAHCRFSLTELRYTYPRELVPAGMTASTYLRQLTEAGARRRWPQGVPPAVRALIEKELTLIAELGYEHYFLTVEDIVAYARSQGILCQGRGSAANSVVCYALHVTEVDPERVGMLFERFISRERAEAPDIDIDFEHDRREEVIQYVYRKYGRERAALAATVICYRPRMAVRDVGKALGFAPDVVNALSGSLQWFDDPEVLQREARRLGFAMQAQRVRWWLKLVRELIGMPRHLSQHVGGFVIADQPLASWVPLENAAMPERTIIQWDKEDLETLGLLKVDCLALGMLSAIRRSLQLISTWQQQPFTLADVPAEDPATYEMLSRADSVGVFQIESRAQMSTLPRLKPRCYYDLVIQVAIIRPGPIQGGMMQAYLQRRAGAEAVTYPGPALQQVLGRTCGVPIFQEQVMQIAMVAAGFSAGEADQVRRSMAAWQRKGGLEHFRDRLLSGMQARGYTSQFAQAIYQQILGFGSYGFPESHAASFALLAYASAWLKCHQPAAFCAGLLNSWPMGFYAPAQLIADARRHGVVFLPMDVQHSDWECTLEAVSAEINTSANKLANAPAIRLGWCLLRGVSRADMQRIITQRQQGNFRDVDDLAARAGLSRRTLTVLARAGALASLQPERQAARWQAWGIEHLPGLLAGHAAREPMVAVPPANEARRIVSDYQSTGFSLERHPLQLLRARFDAMQVRLARTLPTLSSGMTVRVAGLVTHRQRPESAAGVMFITLEDESGLCNLIVWPGIQQAQRAVVLGARLMLVTGELQIQHGVVHVVAKRLRDFSTWLGALSTESRDFH